MVNSIFSHGYIVAKIFFLNPVKCTCIAQLMQGNEGNEEIKKENGRVEETKKELSILSIDKTVHSWTEQKMKINDLQNFVFQNTRYLLINYPEYGKDTEYIENTLIDILEKSTDMLESKRILME